MNRIYSNIRQFISDKRMVVLREKHTGKALNSSFSEYGLQFTTNSSGRYIYFKNAKPVIKNGYVIFEGDTTMNPNVYVEHFVPQNQDKIRNQIAEYTWTDKAYRLCYHIDA